MNGKIVKNNKSTQLLIKSKLVKRGSLLNPSYAFSVGKEWIKSGMLDTSKEYELIIKLK